jgi:TM2 domain-containing membrane protein YozV
MVGLFVLITLIGVFWVYGFGSEIRYANEAENKITGLGTTQQKQTLFGNLQVLASVFAIIGFGLLFSHFKKNTFTAVFTPLFIVSFTTIISPIFQKFWFNVFFTDFKGTVNPSFDPTRLYQLSLSGL